MLGLVGFGLFVLCVGGAVLAIVNWTRVRRLETSSRDLTARVASLERKRVEVASGEPAGERPTLQQPPQPVPEPSVAVLEPTPEPSTEDARQWRDEQGKTILPLPPEPTSLDLENLIAGRWLNRIGIVAVMVAAAFFLKFAFDNEWIGPMGRVAIGLVAGSGLMVASQSFLGRGYRYFSEGIAALGAGVLFLSLYAAWGFYELIPEQAALAGMIVVVASLAGLALGRNSERLAVLALVAGLTTPALLGIGANRHVTLFTFLAILAAGFLILAWRKEWRWIAPTALLGVLLHGFFWAERFYGPHKLQATLLFATLFFFEFALFLLFRSRSRRGLSQDELVLAVANAAWFGVSLHMMLYRDHRWWLTVAALVLGALHLLAAASVRQGKKKEVSAARLVVAGLALTFVTAAIPIRLEGEWITIAWALEATLLVWAGFRSGLGSLRAAGLALFAVVIGLLVTQGGATSRLILNQRFASFAAVVAGLAVSCHWAGSRRRELTSAERQVFAVVGVATVVSAVWGLSEELWYFLARQQWALEPRLAQQMGLSLLWAITAAVLILVGVRRGSRALRWQGLALLGLTIGKVFLLDLSFLERAYRIASVFVLGLVLLVVSFWYQKSSARGSSDDRAEDEGERE
ncbi:MAG: DUF2339 domain-containing protein [Acidobacteriota bacterium]|nr:DUF2339 domain-containing protein [Acidobacteriota bacterium]